jgi:hypothetical protein
MKSIVIIFIIVITSYKHAIAQQWQTDAYPLHRAQQSLTDVIVHDIFSPPVAARIYAYTSMAAYEVACKSNKEYHSLYNQVRDFPDIPLPTQQVITSLAAVYAYMLIGKQLVYSESDLQDSLNHILTWYKSKKLSHTLYTNSLIYGQQVADSITAWMNKDQYKETRKMRRYNFLKQEGKWIPTPPGYIAAIEPYWNKIRTIILDSCSQFSPKPATTFDKDKESAFYKQAYEVYNTGINLTTDQKFIASFWDCNPFAINTDGHLNYATKKISPGGHWMCITALVCQQTGAGLVKSAAAYTMVSIGLFDAFISCWDEKYRSNVIRPETYIDAVIDENWRPFLQTPPFPEYTSGHSVISTASAKILTNMFGNIAFDDDTEINYGLPVRHFSSFNDASNEAAISRLYGGIHYLSSIQNGQTEGAQVGEWVLKKIHLN